MSITVATVVSRRSLLLGCTTVAVVGAGIGGAVATDRLDDALRLVGVTPKPEPDPGDLRLTARARADAEALVTLAAAAQAPADVLVALTAQRDALPTTLPDASGVTGDLDAACLAVADSRAADALAAVSTDLAQVLASMAAGLTQASIRVGSPS